MHAQRCPVAKLRAASQQQHSQATSRGADPRISAAGETKKKQDKTRRDLSAKTQERPSFFQNVHGESAPLLPPHPQMYSDEAWTLTNARPPPHHGHRKEASRYKPLTRLMYNKNSELTQPQAPTIRVHYKETALTKPLAHSVYFKEEVHNTKRKETVDQSLVIFNENCEVHGHSKPPRYPLPKSLSCPSSRQTADVERLKNWRRNSLTLAPSSPNPFSQVPRAHTSATTTPNVKEHRRRPLSQGHELPPLPPGGGQRMVVKQHVSTSRTLSHPSTTTCHSSAHTKNTTQTEDLHGRRSQFRRAWSLFSMGCDEGQKKTQPQSILRQPTRHMYRRGISGLPVECTSMDMGVVFWHKGSQFQQRPARDGGWMQESFLWVVSCCLPIKVQN